MIEENAIVVRVDGDRAYLEIERSQPCGLCGTTQGCGMSLWGRLFSNHRQQSLSMPNALQLDVGDRAVIAMDETALLKSAFTAYVIPLLLVCAGGFIGSSLAGTRAESDLYGVVGAVFGLLLGLVAVRKLGRKAGGQPTMLRRADLTIIRQCSKVIS